MIFEKKCSFLPRIIHFSASADENPAFPGAEAGQP